jgi:nucleoside diphosphate kinase
LFPFHPTPSALQLRSTNQTIGLIKPGVAESGRLDQLIATIQEMGFVLVKRLDITLSLTLAKEFYKDLALNEFYKELTEFMARFAQL